MRQVNSWSVFVVRSVPRSGYKFWTPLWRISIACFRRHMLFSLPRIVCSSAQFPVHTHDISFYSLKFWRTLGVHRIRWCFEPIGAVRAEAVPCCSSVGPHKRHKCRRERRGWARRQLRSKRTYKLRKGRWASDVGQFAVFRDVAIKPSHFFAEYIARTSVCRLMVTTKFCVTSRAANILPATNVWRQAGKCWIMRGLWWVQQRWSDNGRT